MLMRMPRQLHTAFYEALRQGDIPEAEARRAAGELADYYSRLAVLETRMIVLTAMVGLNLCLTAGMLLRLLFL
jgi:hypothetical protein